MRKDKSVETEGAKSQVKGRARLARLAFIGLALALSMFSLAWACTLHGVQSRFVPATGPVGTTVAVVATTLSTYSGTNNIYIDGPITTPATVGDLTSTTLTACNYGVSTTSPVMGTITYVSGAGEGTGTIPTTVRSHTVAAGETYEMCIAAPGFEHFRVI